MAMCDCDRRCHCCVVEVVRTQSQFVRMRKVGPDPRGSALNLFTPRPRERHGAGPLCSGTARCDAMYDSLAPVVQENWSMEDACGQASRSQLEPGGKELSAKLRAQSQLDRVAKLTQRRKCKSRYIKPRGRGTRTILEDRIANTPADTSN
jgi:hypothetical protein